MGTNCMKVHVHVYWCTCTPWNITDSAAIPPPSSLSSTANDYEPKLEDQGEKGRFEIYCFSFLLYLNNVIFSC